MGRSIRIGNFFLVFLGFSTIGIAVDGPPLKTRDFISSLGSSCTGNEKITQKERDFKKWDKDYNKIQEPNNEIAFLSQFEASPMIKSQMNPQSLLCSQSWNMGNSRDNLLSNPKEVSTSRDIFEMCPSPQMRLSKSRKRKKGKGPSNNFHLENQDTQKNLDSLKDTRNNLFPENPHNNPRIKGQNLVENGRIPFHMNLIEMKNLQAQTLNNPSHELKLKMKIPHQPKRLQIGKPILESYSESIPPQKNELYVFNHLLGAPESKKLVPKPVTTNELALHQENISLEFGKSHGNSINDVESQTSGDYKQSLWQLEISEIVLKGSSNPLLEDEPFINEISKLFCGKYIIDETKLEDAKHLFQKCYNILQNTSRNNDNLKVRFVRTKPRRGYIIQQSKIMFDNINSWIYFWEQKTMVLFHTLIPFDANKLKNILALYLFYVEMIENFFPQKKEKYNLEQTAETLRSSMQVFKMIYELNKGCQSKEKKEFLKLHYDISTDDIFSMQRSIDIVIWRCIKIWLVTTGRVNIHQQFFQASRGNGVFVTFFNKIFCLSIESFDLKIKEINRSSINYNS